jgi:GNAT superfamily N-acetyltransferase
MWMKNGLSYEIRPCIEPGTRFNREHLKGQIDREWKALSPQTRWHRFAQAIPELSEQELDYLTDIDGRNHVAWWAAVPCEGGLRGIGICRFVRLQGEADIAEFSLTVIDEFQSQGVGTALFEKLIGTAGCTGIRCLRGYVRPGNRRMLSICKRFQGVIFTFGEALQVDVPVPQNSASNDNRP